MRGNISLKPQSDDKENVGREEIQEKQTIACDTHESSLIREGMRGMALRLIEPQS